MPLVNERNDHVAPHVASKAWVFPMKTLRGAKFQRWIAGLSHGVADFHDQTEVTKIKIFCA